MNVTFAEQVVDFNQVILGIEQRAIGLLPQNEFELSMSCLQEEVDEFEQAHNNGDVIGSFDALVDLMYFATGIMYKMGLTSDQINRIKTAVHEANMTKKRGHLAKRGDGVAIDAVKPDGWVSPEERIALILDEAR